MKTVTDALANYLNTKKEMVVCDLYTLTLYDGTAYYYTDADHDVTITAIPISMTPSC